MKILFIGDTVGKAGRTIVHDHLKYLQEDYAVDLTILNCENAAAGFGVTPKIADELFDWGIDVLTSGNHIWDKKEIMSYLSTNTRILRPANYPADNPGRGLVVLKTRSGEEAAVLNLQGRVFMPPTDDPTSEHYVPPVPPPLPRLDPITKGAWLALFGGPLYLLISTAIGSTISGLAAFLAVAAFVGGFVILVLRMDNGRPPDSGSDDDGAVV